MASLEMVEKLKQRANVTYEEAKQALDACGDDLLDAMIYLEKQGKVPAPAGGGSYTSRQETPPENHAASSTPPKGSGESFSTVMGRFLRFCGRTIQKGNTNLFDVWRGGEIILTLPVTVLVLLLIFCFWFTIPALIIALFFGCHYRFRGRDIERTGVNKAMDGAAQAAESFKQEMFNKDPKNGEHGDEQ